MDVDVVTVFMGDDPVLIAMAETLLQDAGIPFVLHEDEGAARIEVAADREADALAILEELPEGPEIDDDAADSAWNQ